MPFVYLLECSDGSLYCGWTTDLQQRIDCHNAGRGAAYTRARRPVRLRWSEEVPDRSAALRREWAIKQLDRREKIQLMTSR
jgi:putative endonuclease